VTSPFTENLIEKIAAVQRQIDGAAWRTTDETVVGAAENDAVRVHVREDGKATTVEIDPDVVDPHRVGQLERLVAAAVQDASVRLCRLRTERVTAAIRAMIDGLLTPAVGEGR
jgi:DNA-binding protein YbaB